MTWQAWMVYAVPETMRKRYLRTIISGRVFLERIAAMTLLRFSFEKTSIPNANLQK